MPRMTAQSFPVTDHLLRESQTALSEVLQLTSNEARIEAVMLLRHALGNVSSAWLIAHEREALSNEHHAVFDVMLRRRLAGEPIAYILGEREFYGLNFKVTPAVLIPRPETELLVELALQRLPHKGRVLDLGTGCGAIALSIAHVRPEIKMTAVDASNEALEVTRENVKRLKLNNVSLLCSDWFTGLCGERFDCIVCNPPYIAFGDPHLQQGDLRFEPAYALASGMEGLDDIRRIVSHAPAHLVSGGWLMMEHGYEQAARVRELLQLAGFAEVFAAKDLAGIERVSGGRLA